MADPGGPVLDGHMHLDPVNGRGAEAAAEFARAGGTHLIVVTKPSWSLVGAVDDPDAFRPAFDKTVEVAAEADTELRGTAWPVLGVHPALISRLVDRGYTPAEAGELMRAGLDVAAEYVDEGSALALKSGRPHYEVSDEVWAASNQVMCHAFERAAALGCAVQLHTEAGDRFDDVVGWARDRGLSAGDVVKHYASGPVAGPVPSVIGRREALLATARAGDPFTMETDFLDDPDRPGAVLGPKTVPRRVDWLREEGHAAAVQTANVETPATVYGIDTAATLD